MTAGRLAGNRLRAASDERWILLLGGCVAAAGFLVVVSVPSPLIDIFGFVLGGAWRFEHRSRPSITGRSRAMPSSPGIAAITTLGYTGVLVGPAAVGFVAHIANLGAAFLLLALAMAFVAANVRIAKA